MLLKWLQMHEPRPTGDKEIFQHNLLVNLSALAQTKEEQLAFVGIGCAICDLTEDFDMYGVRLYREDEHTGEQNHGISELRSMINAFIDTEQECFDPTVLDREDWCAIREKAKAVLNLFGVRLTSLPRPIEEKPGMWATDILGHQLQPL
jgi:hypothetical protein